MALRSLGVFRGIVGAMGRLLRSGLGVCRAEVPALLAS